MEEYNITASWIAPAGAAEKKNFYFRASKKFNIENLPSLANLHIAVESYYILYINGILVDRGPARGTHTLNFYDTYDVACYLRPGENIISVLCLCMNIESSTVAPAEPALLVEIENILKTDASWDIVHIENEWKQDVLTYTMQAGFCEWRDMRKEPAGWLFRNDNNAWRKAVILSEKSNVCRKKLLSSGIPLLKETEHIPSDVPVTAIVDELKDLEDVNIAKIITEEKHFNVPKEIADTLNSLTFAGEKTVTIKPIPNNGGFVIIFNFKREVVGRFELDINAPAGTIVDITHEEELWNNRLRADHTHTSKSYHLADRYILREGRQKIGNSLFERGFRMVQIVIRNFSNPVTIHDVKAVDCRYPFSEKATFNCSDSLLNRIWDVSRETLSTCTTDIFTDCPWRERSFFVNDLIVENRIALQLFGDNKINKRALQMAFSDAFENGLLPCVCPSPRDAEMLAKLGLKPETLIIVSTNLYITLILKDYYLYSGDSEPLKEHFEEIVKILDIFRSWKDANGIISPPAEYFNFFDWSYETNGYSFTGKKTSMLNYFYIIALKAILELAPEIGFKIDSDKYRREIMEVAKATEKTFFMEDEKRIANELEDGNGDLLPSALLILVSDNPKGKSSQLPHALAVLADENSEHVGRYLMEALTDEKLLIPDFYFHYFIFQAMKKTGQENEILKTIRKYWGEMIKTGTPTLWEAGIHTPGKDAFGGTGSLCHGFASSPVDFFQTVILGVTPSKAGFREFSFKPFALDLESAEGAIPTPHGNIEVKWRKSGDRLLASLKVPENCKAVTADGILESGYHKVEIKQEN